MDGGARAPVSVTLAAKPAPITIDFAKTAMIVVDMQNDFGSKGGMFDRAGVDISPIERVVAPTARALATCRAAGIKIVYLKMGFNADLSDLGPVGSPNHDRHIFFGAGKTIQAPNGSESRVLIRDTWGTDVISELKPQNGDVVMYKHRFSGFFQTGLDATLQKFGVKYLLMTGCTTSVCVESTIRDAAFRDYSCVLLADCAAEPIGNDLPRSNHDASLLVLQTLFAWTSTSEEFIRAARPALAAGKS